MNGSGLLVALSWTYRQRIRNQIGFDEKMNRGRHRCKPQAVLRSPGSCCCHVGTPDQCTSRRIQSTKDLKQYYSAAKGENRIINSPTLCRLTGFKLRLKKWNSVPFLCTCTRSPSYLISAYRPNGDLSNAAFMLRHASASIGFTGVIKFALMLNFFCKQKIFKNKNKRVSVPIHSERWDKH